jgi:TonB-linked SusC/RagA family outer membrane protein
MTTGGLLPSHDYTVLPIGFRRRGEGALSHSKSENKTKPIQGMKKSFTTKPWTVMKICATQWMIAIFIAGVSMAHDSKAQLLDQEITIDLSGVPFEKALRQIENLTKVKFFYSVDQLAREGVVSLRADKRLLGDVLNELFTPRNIQYRVHEREATITLRKEDQGGYNGESIMNEGIKQSKSRPLIQITGTVTDTNGQPMAGVNILVKGTTVGTTTGADGKYMIDANDVDILVFSFIGYASVEEPVNARSMINVSLVEDILSLKDVVVNAGYYTTTKREQTGNIARVTAEDIERQPVPNALMAIQGRMPGVVITQTSGIAGSGIRIQIRGQNSLRDGNTNNGNYPLYVVDGVPIDSRPMESYGLLLNIGGIDPLNTINPANLESIEILKDADATAIYGSRGANGVVLITTKKGKAGATDVDVCAYAGAGMVSKMIDVMNTEQYLAMRNEAFANDGATPGTSDYDLNGTWDQTSYTDWQRKLYGETANISDVQASVSGGSGMTSFRFGGGYHKETTVFPGDFGYKKMTGYFNLNHATIDQKLKLTLSVNYGQDDNNLFDKDIVSYALTLPPNAPVYDDQGNLNWSGYTSLEGGNPLSYFKISHNSKTSNLISNAVLSYEILKDLRLVANLGFSDTNTSQLINRPQSSMNPTNPSVSKSNLLDYSGKNWIVEPQITYNGALAKGRLDILLGTTWQANNTKTFGVEGEGFVSDGLLGNIKAASSIAIGTDTETGYRYNAIFGRIGYIWADKYLLNLTARRDGSSRFGADKQFGNFGAIGVGWIFSNETFIKKSLPYLSFGKLRSSYGTTGSDKIPDYGFISTYSPSPYSYQGTSILNTTSLANPSFRWEVNKKLELALDLGFLQNRIQFDVSWYRNRSSNQLVGYPLPTITGFTTVQYNLDATVQNTGWEFEMTAVNVEKGHFKWTTTVNLTVPKNELISYPNLAGSSYASTYVVGEPLTISRRYKFVGVDPETGFYEILDLDEDKSYSTSDQSEVVDLSRNYYGGLQNSVSYRSIELGFLLEFVKQKASDYISLFVSHPGTMYNQPVLILSKSRWRQYSDQAQLQKFTQAYSSNYYYASASDLSQTDASYIRLKTVYLSFHFPSGLLKSLKMKDGQIYVQAQNLFTITNYYGLNPESPFKELPPLRVFSAGVQLKF